MGDKKQSAKQPLDIEKLRQEYREGRSLRELAQETDYSHIHLWRLLQAAGEPMRKTPRQELQTKMAEARKEQADLMRRCVILLFKGGVTIPEIAVALGYKAVWVRSVLREASIYAP
jgi:hypothetical protein